MGKLGERAALARLAGAGDHVDFVVTLLSAGGETVGRVERQTESGTVAIRELRDASCARVADALALSLGLSLRPKGGSATPQEPSTLDAAIAPVATLNESPAAPASAPVEPSVAPRESRANPPLGQPPERDAPLVSEARSERAPEGGWLGLQGGVLSGVAPRALVRAAAFVAVEDVLPELVSGASLRIGPAFAFGSAPTSVGSIERWLLAGRVEGCPVRWGSPSLGVTPCLGFELGVTHAQASGAESGESNPWLTAGAGLRGALRLVHGLSLEAQTEAQLPLYKNDVLAGSETIYRQESLAFQGGLGISARLW